MGSPVNNDSPKTRAWLAGKVTDQRMELLTMPIACSYTARGAALGLAVVALMACGSESTAASNGAQGNAAMSAALSVQPTATPQAAPAAALPVDQGIYARADQGCARATEILFYDGANFGEIQTNEEWEGNDGPSSDVEPISRIGPPRTTPDADFAAASRGFTLAWSAAQDGGDFPSLAVKPAGAGRFARLSTSGNTIISYDEDTYQNCAFAQLSSQMQAAIRSEHPQLAGGTSPADGAGLTASIPAPVAPFNIRPGHYVPVGAACGTTSEMIFYYDGRRAGWIDLSPFAANRMEPVANAQRRGADWVVDAMTGETVQVQAAEEIAIGDPNTGVETMRWCPANEVRASARAS